MAADTLPSMPADAVPPPPDHAPLSQATPYPSPPGYRLREPIGAGGMGQVFAADQPALGREVAVKFVRADGVARTDLLARFRTEAAALGRAAHPNIVQVFEVGEVGGWPFLVLELVPGGTLGDKLRGGPLAPRAAAEIVFAVAGAVAAAHAAGIVHRDLKPANVLLAADGTPKVTDFGLAKAVAADADTPSATRTGVIVGTPSYMAPEQARGGGDVGPAADVYSLGALLYECLTGRVPFRAASAVETLHLVCTADPPAVRHLQPGVPRDLETVCLKCLRKDPAHRYPSAAAVADDLSRFLAGRPVTARPLGPVPRATMWVRRNPAWAAAAGVAAAALAAGAAGVAVHTARLQAAFQEKADEEAKARREKDRADANYRDARAAVRAMLTRVEDPRYAAVPRLQELHRAQAADALAYFRAVAAQRDDPSAEVRADAARADFETGRTLARLGDAAAAADHYRRAIDGFDRLLAENPADRGVRLDRANARGFLARDRGDDEAFRLMGEAVADLTALAAEPAATFEERSALANALNMLGAAHLGCKRFADAEPLLRQALAVRDELAPIRPDDRWSARHRADVLTNLSALCQQTERLDEAAAFHDRAAAALQAIVDADPDDRPAVATLAILRVNWAYALAERKKHGEALDRLSRSVGPLERLSRLEPNDVYVRELLFRVHGVRAQVAEAAGRFAEAVADCEKVVAYCPAGQRRFQGWFLARMRLNAGDAVGAVRDLERLAGEVGTDVPYGEPLHGAETAALAAARLQALAAAAGGSVAPVADRAEAAAVRLLGLTRTGAGALVWLELGPAVAGSPTYRPLRGRADYRRLVGGSPGDGAAVRQEP